MPFGFRKRRREEAVTAGGVFYTCASVVSTVRPDLSVHVLYISEAYSRSLDTVVVPLMFFSHSLLTAGVPSKVYCNSQAALPPCRAASGTLYFALTKGPVRGSESDTTSRGSFSAAYTCR